MPVIYQGAQTATKVQLLIASVCNHHWAQAASGPAQQQWPAGSSPACIYPHTSYAIFRPTEATATDVPATIAVELCATGTAPSRGAGSWYCGEYVERALATLGPTTAAAARGSILKARWLAVRVVPAGRVAVASCRIMLCVCWSKEQVSTVYYSAHKSVL